MRIRITHLLFAGLLAGAVFSCQVPESQKEPQIFEVKVKENPTALESSIEVSVSCDLHWTAELKDSSWGSVEVTQVKEGSGGTFVFKMGVNTNEEARENTLIVKAGKGTLEKKITQGGLATFFTPRSVQLVGTGQTDLSFPSPSAWTATVSQDDASWLGISPASGSKGNAHIAVQAKDANENVGPRSGIIRISIGQNSFDIPVTQGQTDVIVLSGDTQLDLPFEAQEFSVLAQYNVDYKVESSVSWISHATSKAPLYERLEKFVVEENTTTQPRSGEIRFTGGKAQSMVVTVSQQGKDPILMITQPGFYGVNGNNYIKGAEAWNQSSVLVSADSSMRYRLLNAQKLSVVDLTSNGFRSARKGDQISLHLTIKTKSSIQLTKDYPVVLLYEKDGLAWYKESDNTYFILEK